MIKQEEVILGGNTFIHTYSDSNFYIEQIETGSIYDETYDVIPCRFTYRETDKLIEKKKLNKENTMEIKAIVIKKDSKAIDCYEVVSFSVEQFNQMLKTCERNKKTLNYEQLRKEQQLNNRIYALEKELALLKQKVENNTKLILGETTDEK